MEKKNFEKLKEYKRNYISDKVKKAKKLANEIDLVHNFDEENQKYLLELRKVLNEIEGFR